MVEREALAAARAEDIAAHQGYYRRLERIAELDRLGVAAQTGDRSTERLVRESWRVGPGKAGRLVAEAADLAPRRSLHGQPLPPRLPCTAMVLASGEISPEHVAVIRRDMGRIDELEHVDPGEVPQAEAYLAEKATLFPPKKLAQLAQQLLAHLDPDGAAPDEDADLFDDLKMTSCRDGSLEMRIKIHDPVDAEMIREGVGMMSTPTDADDHRPLGNRQACALKEVFADALGPNGLVTDTRDGDDHHDHAEPGTPAGESTRAPMRGPGRPLLTITMDYRWLQLAIGHGTLDSGALCDPATVRRWACDAEIVPLVLGSKSEPLDIGRRSRLVPDAMRRAPHGKLRKPKHPWNGGRPPAGGPRLSRAAP